MAEEDLTTLDEPGIPTETLPANPVSRARQQLQDLGANLTPGQKIVIGGTSLAVLVGLIAVVGVASHMDWRPLFTRLDPSDAAAITSQLDADRVPYQVRAGGTAIMVPLDRVDEVRLRVAAAGLPKGGNVGFELFDDSDPWSGRREHDVRNKRALEGELARTISRIEGVRTAKVHLALPEESVFVDQDKPPTGSVMVDMIPGRTLLPGQVDGIQRLIAAGVERLEVGAVEVVDGRGELLSKPADIDGKNSALDFKNDVERALEDQALKILEPMLGKGNVQVRVNADVDFRKIRERIEIIDDEKVVVSHETRSSEKRDPLAPGPGGVPGARAPTPEGLQAVGGGLATERKQEDISYTIPKTMRTVEAPVGALTRMSVAVVINGAYEEAPGGGGGGDDDEPAARQYRDRTDEEMAKYATLVKNAIGFSDQRGDSITVAQERFQAEVLTAGPPPYWFDLIRSLTPWLVALLIAVLLVLFGVRPLVKFATAPPESDIPILSPEEAEAALASGAIVAGLTDGEGSPLVMGEDGLLIPADEADRELLAGMVAGGNDPSRVIREFAQQDPARTAQVLRRWLAKG